jgi:hypothetical protein
MAKKKTSGQRVTGTKKRRLLLASGTIMLLAIALFTFFRVPEKIESGGGVMATPVTVHDFGLVPVSRGVVSTEVPLANIGEDDLVISFLDSSCGCTTAQIINDGESGPIFGMSSHGKSPRDWKTIIAPGKKASLKIFYDPRVHPNFRGPGTRVVTIFTNAKSTPEKQVRIEVNQVD